MKNGHDTDEQSWRLAHVTAANLQWIFQILTQGGKSYATNKCEKKFHRFWQNMGVLNVTFVTVLIIFSLNVACHGQNLCLNIVKNNSFVIYLQAPSCSSLSQPSLSASEPKYSGNSWSSRQPEPITIISPSTPTKHPAVSRHLTTYRLQENICWQSGAVQLQSD